MQNQIISRMAELVTTFGELANGEVCRVVIMDKEVAVRKQAWRKDGSKCYNARRLDGRRGETFVYPDMRVIKVEVQQ